MYRLIRSLLIFGILISLNRFKSLQGAEKWEPIGPNSATVFSMVADPFNENTFYAGTYFGGLYHSTNGGTSWAHLPSAFSGSVIFSVAADPSNPGKLFVGVLAGGMYQSLDAGETWAAVTNGIGNISIQSIAFDPNRTRSMLAASFQGVYRSSDGGQTWLQSNGGLTNLPATTILYHPIENRVVLVGTSGSGVFQSVDGGTNWQAYSTGLGNATVNSFSVRSGTNEIYASTTAGVYLLDSNTSQWTNISFNLSATNISQTVPRSDGGLFAVSDKGIFLLATPSSTNWTLWGNIPSRILMPSPVPGSYLIGALFNRLMITYDQGKTFLPADNGMQNRFVGALTTLNSSDQTVIYAGTDFGVEFTSEAFRTAAGLPWIQGGNFGGSVFAVMAPDPNGDTLFAAAERIGVLKGTNFGTKWAPTSTGLIPRFVNALAESTDTTPRLFAGTTDGFYISTNNGVSWSPDRNTRTPEIVTTIITSPGLPNTVFYATANGNFSRSFDGGEIFQRTWQAPGGEGILQLAWAPFFNVYAIGAQHVFVSTDNGATFFPATAIKERALSAVVNPIRPWIAYVGTSLGGVYRTTNNAIEWQKSNEGLSVPVVYSLAIDPNNDSIIYAGSTDKIFTSTNAGASWRETSSGLPVGNVSKLVVDPNDTTRIFASVSGAGIYRSIDSGQAWSPFLSGPAYNYDPPILVSRAAGHALFAGTRESGIARSVDGGASWNFSNEGMSLFIRGFAIDPITKSNMYAGSLVDGVFKSSNGGATWSAKGLADRAIYGIVVDPVQPRNVYLATSSGIAASRDYGETWYDKGQQIAFIFDILHDPTNSNHFFITGAQGDLFETMDAGLGWTAAHQGLPRVNIISLAADWQTGVLYAAAERTGVFKSIDGGKTWKATTQVNVANSPVLKLAVVQDTHAILAGTDSGGVLMSTNGGATWKSQGLNDRDQVSDFAYDSGRKLLYAATSIGVARSSDLGKSWTDIGQRAPYILQMLVDPHNRSNIFVGTVAGGVYSSVDGGQEWTEVDSGLPALTIFALAMNPYNGLLYASPERDGVYRSSNGGKTWQPTANATLGNAKITQLAVDPGTGDVYALTDGEGFFISRNAGSSWVHAGPTNYHTINSIEFSASSPGSILLGTSLGVIQSDDSGETWTELGQKLPFTTQVVSDPRDRSIVYAAGFAGELYRSEDLGAAWEIASTGLPLLNIYALGINPVTGVLYAAPERDGMYASTNAGASWTRIDISGLTNTLVSSLAVSSDGSNMYVSTLGAGILRSLDGGKSWLSRSNGLSSVYVSSVAIDPYVTGRIYATTLSEQGSGPGVYLSTNFAQNWSPITNGIAVSSVLQVATSPHARDLLFAVADKAIYRSENGGQSWVESTNGLGSGGLRSIAMDSSGPDLFYAGSTNGIFISNDGGHAWSAASLPFTNLVISTFATGPEAGIIYVGSLGNGVLRSTDFGMTWEGGVDPRLVDAAVLSVASNPASSNVLYGVVAQGGFIKSIDGGLTWSRTGTGLESTNLQTILVDPNEPNRLYIGTTDHGVYVSHDSGTNWTHAQSEFSGLNVLSLAPGKTPGSIYVGSLGNGLLESQNRGATLTGGVLPELVNPLMYSVKLDSRQPDTLYASIDPAGIIKSTNGGLTWRRFGTGLENVKVHALVNDPVQGDRLWVNSEDGAVFRSDNSGESWSRLSTVPTGLQIKALSKAGGALYAGTLGNGLIQSSDDGVTWTGGASPDVIKPIVFGVAVDPQSPSRVFAATSGSGMLLSEDHGQTWTASNAGMDARILFAVTIDPLDSRYVYAATSGSGVFASADRGQTWIPLNDGLFNKTITSMAIDVNDHRTLYAGTEGGGVFRMIREALTPNLRISKGGEQVSAVWRSPALGFVLEESPSLSPANWTVVSNPTIQTNSEIKVIFPQPAGNRFFRLKGPPIP